MGKPDPAKMQAFLSRHPETARVLTALKGQPVSSGFENSTFHGLNAFRFINAAGDSTPVRWLLTPEQPFELHAELLGVDPAVGDVDPAAYPLRWTLWFNKPRK